MVAQSFIVLTDVAAELFPVTREVVMGRGEAGHVDVHEVRATAHHAATPVHPGLDHLPPAREVCFTSRFEIGEADPLIGTNGARCADDVIRFLLSGARAVELAGVVLTNGAEVFTRILADLQTYGERKKIARLADIVGKAADAALPYGALSAVSRSAYPWDRYLTEPKGE